MLVDAHCHPTETAIDYDELPAVDIQMAAMATSLADQDKVSALAERLPQIVIPSFGLHPWFSHQLALEIDGTDGTEQSKLAHYQRILDPSPTAEDIAELPHPELLRAFIVRLEERLHQHPQALVGEIGLDRAFRLRINKQLSKFKVKLDHQRAVLDAQLAVAVQYQRAVSLHGVQAAQPLYQAVLANTPPGVCLHAYGGSPELLRDAWLRMQVPIYVSICELVHGRMHYAKLEALLATIPADRVLTESDYHSYGGRQVALVEQSLARVCKHFGWSHSEALDQISGNWRAYSD